MCRVSETGRRIGPSAGLRISLQPKGIPSTQSEKDPQKSHHAEVDGRQDDAAVDPAQQLAEPSPEQVGDAKRRRPPPGGQDKQDSQRQKKVRGPLPSPVKVSPQQKKEASHGESKGPLFSIHLLRSSKMGSTRPSAIFSLPAATKWTPSKTSVVSWISMQCPRLTYRRFGFPLKYFWSIATRASCC